MNENEQTEKSINGHTLNLGVPRTPDARDPAVDRENAAAAVVEDAANGETDRSREIRGREASRPPANATPQPRKVRWSNFSVDGNWPPPGVHHVDVSVPGPALFSKAYAFRERVAGLDGQPQVKLRAVFVVCPDAPPIPIRLLTMSSGMAILAVEGKPQPMYLDTIPHPVTAEPLGLWLIPPEGAAADADADDDDAMDSPIVDGEDVPAESDTGLDG